MSCILYTQWVWSLQMRPMLLQFSPNTWGLLFIWSKLTLGNMYVCVSLALILELFAGLKQWGSLWRKSTIVRGFCPTTHLDTQYMIHVPIHSLARGQLWQYWMGWLMAQPTFAIKPLRYLPSLGNLVLRSLSLFQEYYSHSKYQW